MTDKLELKSSHEVIETVNVANVDSIFYCKPTDPDILTVLMKDGKRLYCDEVCPINSLQEEPVSEKKCIFTKDNYTDEDRKVLCEDCKEKCEYSKKEEHVSEELEEAASKYAHSITCSVAGSNIRLRGCNVIGRGFKSGAEWQKEQMMAEAIETTFNVSLPSGLYDKLWIKGCKESDKLLVIKKDQL